MNKVYILAGNHDQAKNLARWHDMAPHEWQFLSHDQQLYGAQNQTLWLYGTWQDRKEASGLIVLAKYRGFKVFTLEDRT